MNDANPERDSRLLLIRIRPARDTQAPAGQLALEVEAILDYESIFPSTTCVIDMPVLQSSIASPNNIYGQLLGGFLASAPSVQQAMAAIGQPESLRVQLMLEGSGPHESIRWERLAVPIRPGDPISLRRDTPFSRFAAVDLPQESAPEDTRFHLLVAIASPNPDEVGKFEVAPIDPERECDAIIDACEDLLTNGQMELTLLPGKLGVPEEFRSRVASPYIHILDGYTTAERVASALDGVHGLHIIAHGRQGKRFNLILEDESLGMVAQPDTQVIQLWQPPRLRLIFLQSCQSAALRAANDPRPFVNGFMQQLVKAGAAAVVAMQDFVRIEDAREFNRGFYVSLIRDGLVDVAANNGRRLLRNSIDAAWSIPAVTTRLKGGAVWRESPLRAAQKRLRDRIHKDRQVRSYPLFPVDVGAVLSDDLRNRSTDPTRDTVEAVYGVGEGVRSDAFRALTEFASRPDTGDVVCLVAPHGRAKSTLLEALFLSEADRHWRGEQPAIPVMLRMEDLAHTGFDAERGFATSISNYFRDRAGALLDSFYVLNCFDAQPFLFLISGDEDMGESAMQKALKTFEDFRATRRRSGADPHRYIITLDQAAITIADLPPGSTCFIIQPMSVERVTAYLREFPSEKYRTGLGQQLLNRVAEGLWDLAEVPWVLSEMLDQANRGVLGKTRAEILQRIVDDRISLVTSAAGARARVEYVLCGLAWQMYSKRKFALGGTDLFDLLVRLRGNRDYSLVDFRSQLINPCHMMAASEEEGLRFAYPGFRSYCCALYLYRQPPTEREHLLEEITATLGRRARAQLWEEVLLILAGLWPDTGSLLRMILSGVALTEGDQIYIAARCLQEARQAFPNNPEDPVVTSIISGLVYRSHPRSLRSVAARRKAIQFLGPLKESKTIPHLVSLAIKKIRPDARGNLTYDFSGVRLAAIKALLYSPDAVLAHVREDPAWSSETELHNTLEAWLCFDCDRLCAALDNASNDVVAAVAAFALGLTKLPGAQAALEKRFLSSGTDEDLLWAVTDALLELGDPGLTKLVSDNLDRMDLETHIAYLIGKIGSSRANSAERKFLENRLDAKNLAVRGRCLQSLAELRDTSVLEICHSWLNETNVTLRYYALQAVRHIGTEQSLALLTESQWSAENDAVTSGSLSLERLRLEVYEDIYWRLAGGKSREIMGSIAQISAKESRS